MKNIASRLPENLFSGITQLISNSEERIKTAKTGKQKKAIEKEIEDLKFYHAYLKGKKRGSIQDEISKDTVADERTVIETIVMIITDSLKYENDKNKRQKNIISDNIKKAKNFLKQSLFKGKLKSFDNDRITKNKNNAKEALREFKKKVAKTRPDFVEHLKKSIVTDTSKMAINDYTIIVYNSDENWPIEIKE